MATVDEPTLIFRDPVADRPLYRILSKSASLRHLGVVVIIVVGLITVSVPQLTVENSQTAFEAVSGPRLWDASLVETVRAYPRGDGPPLGLTLPWLGWTIVPYPGVESVFVWSMLALSAALMLFGLGIEHLSRFRVAAWTLLVCLVNPIVLTQMQSPAPIALAALAAAGAFALMTRRPALREWKTFTRWLVSGALLGIAAAAVPLYGAITFAAWVCFSLARLRRAKSDRTTFDLSDWDCWAPIVAFFIGWILLGGWWLAADVLTNGIRISGGTQDRWPLEGAVSRTTMLALGFAFWSLAIIGIATSLPGEPDRVTIFRRRLLSFTLGVVVTFLLIVAVDRNATPLKTEWLFLLAVLLAYWSGRGLEAITQGVFSPKFAATLLSFVLAMQVVAVAFSDLLSTQARAALVVLAATVLVLGTPAVASRTYRPFLTDRGFVSLLIALVFSVGFLTTLGVVRTPTPYSEAGRLLKQQFGGEPFDRIVLMTEQPAPEPLLLILRTQWPRANVDSVREWGDVSFIGPAGQGDEPETLLLAWGEYEVRRNVASLDAPLVERMRPFYILDEPVRGFQTQTDVAPAGPSLASD